MRIVGKTFLLSFRRLGRAALLRFLPEAGFEGVGVVQAAVVEGECSQIPNGGERDLGALKFLYFVNRSRNVEGKTFDGHLEEKVEESVIYKSERNKGLRPNIWMK